MRLPAWIIAPAPIEQELLTVQEVNNAPAPMLT